MRPVSGYFAALVSHLTAFRSALAGPSTVYVAAPGVVCGRCRRESGGVCLPTGSTVYYRCDRCQHHWSKLAATRVAGRVIHLRSILVTTLGKLVAVSFARVLLTCTSAIVLASWPAAGADLRSYHAFALGMSTADVVARTSAKEADVKTLHERPSLLEELSWRRPYQSAPTADDSIDTIVFDFVDGQLFRINVGYEPDRTEGLTNEDMIASLVAIYGPRSTRPARRARRSEFESIDTPTVLATWRDGDSTIALTQSAFSRGYGLIITSTSLEALAKKAEAVATATDTREAPAREAARAKAAAEAERAAATKTRSANKAAFKP